MFHKKKIRKRCGGCCLHNNNVKCEQCTQRHMWVTCSPFSLSECQTLEIERKATPCCTSDASMSSELIISDVRGVEGIPCCAASDWFQKTIKTSLCFLLVWKTACQCNGARWFGVQLRQIELLCDCLYTFIILEGLGLRLPGLWYRHLLPSCNSSTSQIAALPLQFSPKHICSISVQLVFAGVFI